MTLRRRLLPLAFLAALLSPSAAAQERAARGTLSGRVLDAATEAPLPSASVAVWRVAEAGAGQDTTLVTGSITDGAGVFRAEGLRPGRYRVVVSFVGYETAAREDVALGRGGVDLDLGALALAPDVESLGSVEVAAERPPVQLEIDRTVYATADDPVAASGTAATVLETIPSVELDVDGNVSLRGSGNVAILINGRPAPVSGDLVATYLQQLPAGAIERVEVIPNPSARFEPDGMSGIINIVLKEDAERGLGGTLSAGVDSRGGYSATGLATYGGGPWSLSASYGFRDEKGDGGGSGFRLDRTGDPLTFRDDVETEDEFETSHFLNLAADYALSPRTTLSAAAQGGYETETEEELNTFLSGLDGAAPTLGYERLVVEDEEQWNTDLRLALTHRFSAAPRGDEAHTLAVEGRYNASSSDGDESFREALLAGYAPSEADPLDPLQLARSERDRSEASLQVDYVRPLAGFRLEAGYQGDLETIDALFFSETERGGVLAPDAGLNNVFDFEVQIHAVYGQLAREWGPLGLQAGLRLETARTTFTLESEPDPFENDYASAFPSAFLAYELSENDVLKASYSRRINRPRTRALNPFPSQDDPSNLRVGNPALRPEYVDAVELGYVRYVPWGSLTLTPYFRRTSDQIGRVTTFAGGVFTRTFENFDTADSYGAELVASFEGGGALDGLRGYGSLEGYRVVSDGSNVDADLQNDALGWGGRLNASYALGDRFGLGDLGFQATVFYRAPMDTEQGRIGSRSWTNLALRQDLLDGRASLTLQARDPFDTAGFAFTLDQPEYYQELERSWGAQRVGLTFSYTFGQPERNDRDDRGGGDLGGEEF